MPWWTRPSLNETKPSLNETKPSLNETKPRLLGPGSWSMAGLGPGAWPDWVLEHGQIEVPWPD